MPQEEQNIPSPYVDQEELPTEAEKIADELTRIACLQYDAGVKYRQPKLEKILDAENLYFNIVQKTLRGRFNIPLPIVSGFVDTQLSKIDDEIKVNFDHTETADKLKARKAEAGWAYDSAPTRGMWAIKDILVKKLAIFSGRGIYKIFSESDPTYKNYFDIVDAFDFIAEPSGGWHLENHLFCGQENIFRTKEYLEEAEHYNQVQVQKLIATTTSDDYKKNQEIYRNKQVRLNQLGFDPQTNNYVGNQVISLVEWNMEHKNKRYYLLFERCSGIWIRCCPLEEITGEPNKGEKPKYMWKSWATHYDYWNFWSKAPVDDVVPLAIGLKTVVNFMFDDMQKKLWGQRLYDPEMIPDPSQLEWDRPDKLIATYVPAGKVLSQGVYQFDTADNSTITINLTDYFRNFIAVESGITPQTKGASEEKVLGIAEINAGEVADRLGLLNKSYSQCYAELGDAWLRGIKMCLDKPMLVRMIGEEGTESAELTKEDLEFSSMPDIRITGGKTEAMRNQQVKDSKAAALVNTIKLFPETINKKLGAESLLENGGWTADEISALMDVSLFGNEKESIKASQAIQDAIQGKPLKLYNGATTRFTQKILNYVNENEDDPKVNALLSRYVLAHKEIVIKNMARESMIRSMSQPMDPNMPAGGDAVIPQNNNPIQA